MNWLLALTIIYIALLFISLSGAKGRLIVPGVLFFGSFSAMLVTANILNGYLRLQLKEQTFRVMAVAGLIFFMVEQLYRLMSQSVRRARGIRASTRLFSPKSAYPIIIQPFIQNVLVIFMALSVGLALLYVFLFTGGARSWNEMMHTFRENRNSISGVTGWTYSLLGQTKNLANAIVLVCSYILVYNKRVCDLSIELQKKLVLVDLLYIPMTIIGVGGRQATVEMILFICLVVFLLMPVSKKKVPFWKLAILAVVFLVVFALVFTGTAALVGRADKYRDPILYITDYLCGGIINLNNGIENPRIHEYWGQATFAGVYRFAAKYGLAPSSAVLTKHAIGWRGEYAATTTVTIFGRWFEDFGAVGVYVMTGIVALIFSVLLYSKCDTKPAPNKYHVIYIWFSMALVWAAYDDRVYSLMSVGTVTVFVWVSFFYWLLIERGSRFKFVIGKSKTGGFDLPRNRVTGKEKQ